MGDAKQLLDRIQAAALKGVAERLADYDIDVADLRSLGVADVLRIAFEAAAQIAFDMDTAEMPLPMEGQWDDETTEPIGVHNRGSE